MSLLVTACKDDDPGSSNAEDVAEDTIIDSGSEDAEDSSSEDISQIEIELFTTACETQWELWCEALYVPECLDESRNYRSVIIQMALGRAITDVPISTTEDCILFSLEYCSNNLRRTAILNGDVFNEENTFTCLSTFEEYDCHERISFRLNNKKFCYHNIVGFRDTNESCFWDRDCINENEYCIGEDYLGEYEGGICGSLFSENETCSLGSIDDCEDSFLCKYFSEGNVCTSTASEGESCEIRHCETGICNDQEICIPYYSEGEACEYSFYCEPYLYCYNGICTAAE